MSSSPFVAPLSAVSADPAEGRAHDRDFRAETVRRYMESLHPSEEFWKGAVPGVLWTDGIKFVAETLIAHWLFDLLATYSIHDDDNPERQSRHWTLRADEHGDVELVGRDESGREVAVHGLHFVTLPDKLLPLTVVAEWSPPADHRSGESIRLAAEHGRCLTLMLPEERL